LGFPTTIAGLLCCGFPRF